eukprot:TRINITY_DN1787_c0_g1_i1.p1 TRINITY_DN1787_c0_g1~~TRINITY_DN1787_c0_g1_i1.p1  ORF type:complete len:1092 (+),score=516.84 TRINITY_DN1787_c0_g1_i1:87-3362(+)
MAADLEVRAREFLSRVIGAPQPDQSLQEFLKDGTVLCNMFNKLVPGNPIKKINTSALPFKQIENISTYLTTCTKVGGIPEAAQFDTTDLFEDKGMLKVLQHLDYVQRHETELASIDPTKINDKSKDAQKKGVPIPTISMRKIPTPRPSLNDIGGAPPSVSSLEADIETKEEMKFNPELERMARNWIGNVLKNDSSCPPIQSNKPLAESLKSGVLLCKLINEVVPGTIPKIHSSNIAYQQMENIRNYLSACGKIGLSSLSVFDVPDLYDAKNLTLVIQNIHSLAAHVKSKITDYKGPQMEEEDISKTKSLFSSSLVETELDFLSQENEGEEATEKEEKELVAWVNSQLAKSDSKDKNNNPLKIKNLGASLRSGVKLIELLKVLTQSTHVGSYVREPATLWDCMRNARQALKFLSYQTLEGFKGCNSRDIVSGNVNSLTNLIEYLREKFDVDFLFQQIVNNISVDSKSNAPSTLSSSQVIDTLKEKEEREKESRMAERKQREKKERELREVEEKRVMEEQKKKLEEQEKQLEKMRLEKKQREAEVAKQEAAKKKELAEQERKIKEEEASRKVLEEKQRQLEEQRKLKESKKETEEKLKEEARKIEEEKLQLAKKIREREELDLKAKKEQEQRDEEERKLAKKLQEQEKKLMEEKKKLEEERKKMEEDRKIKEAEDKKRREEEDKETARKQEEAKKAAAAAASSPPTDAKRKDTVNSESARVQAARYVVRKKIATELLTTEQSYLKNLNLVKTLVEKVRSQKIVESDILFKVFANTEDLVSSHTLFHQDLEGALKDWKDENSTVGNIILKHSASFLPLYRPYIHNFNSSFATVHYLRKKVANFQKTVNTFENEFSSLDSFLILPVQRIPRYILLLRDMMKYTDESHSDYPLLKQASSFLDEGLKNINSSIDNSIMENTTKIIEIENIIDGLHGEYETLLAPGRKFIREGRLALKIEKDKKASAKLKGKSPFSAFKKSESNPYFALFSDILIYCEGKKDAKKVENYRASRMVDGDEKLFDFRGVIPVSSLVKVELLKESNSAFSKKVRPNGVVVTTNPESSENFLIFGQTPQEQSVWLNDLILALLTAEKERMRK